MRALIQRLDTGLYFQGLEQWTANSQAAFDFKSSVNARNYCVQHGIPNVQIILKFDLDKYDIILPARYPQTRDDPPGPGVGC